MKKNLESVSLLLLCLLQMFLISCNSTTPLQEPLLSYESSQLPLPIVTSAVKYTNNTDIEPDFPADRMLKASAPVEPPETGMSSEYSILKVHFLDVGQGDSILIKGKTQSLLIDGSTNEYSDFIIKYLENEEVTRIDTLIATHAHSDHIGGLAKIIQQFDIGSIFMPKIVHTTRAFENLLDAIAKKDYKITPQTVGKTILIDDAVLTILAPLKEYTDLNDSSIVIRLVHVKNVFLFTGDIEAGAEQDILNSGAELHSNVLKIAHHGSDTSSTEAFLESVSPEYAVIPVGADNPYGHPVTAVLNRLDRLGAVTYRTDLHGTVIFTSDGYSLSATTEKQANVSLEAAKSTVQSIISQTVAGNYIGNKNTKKFHLPTCHTLPAEKNHIYFSTRQEAIDAKCSPCGNCKP